MSGAVTILIAVGANLPGPWGERPVETCDRAADALARLPGLECRAVSRWYRSAPVPRAAQPDYANGVVGLHGIVDPALLLARLQAIEVQAGRVRGPPNAARTLDLDIIDVGGALRDSPDPVLPHPRASARAFVLLPLRDVSPGWVHPRTGRSVDELIAALRQAPEGCGGPVEPLGWPVPYR